MNNMRALCCVLFFFAIVLPVCDISSAHATNKLMLCMWSALQVLLIGA